MSPAHSLVVNPSAMLGGAVRIPGDKSISHRAAMFSAIAEGESVIENFLISEDCLSTIRAMEVLGATVRRAGPKVTITGVSGGFRPPPDILNVGNSGTSMRLLAGLLAGSGVGAVLTGDASLSSRPMKRIKEPLDKMGAQVDLTGERGTAPIRIQGGRIHGIRYKLPVASAQVKSCVLMAGLFAKGRTTVLEPSPTRDHTELLLRAMGVDVTIDGLTVSLLGAAGMPSLSAGKWKIPGDFSSAAFWLVAAACCPGAEIVVKDVGLNPRRTALLGVLRRMGVDYRCMDVRCLNEWEPRGDIRVRGVGIKATEVGGDEIPNLIDELPLIMVAGAIAEGTTVIRDAAELRVKESDRIRCMARGLQSMGVDLDEQPDGMVIRGGKPIRGTVEVDSCGDHRIGMALSVLSLFADGPVKIKDTGCIATSYPSFWDHLRILSQGSG